MRCHRATLTNTR